MVDGVVNVFCRAGTWTPHRPLCLVARFKPQLLTDESYYKTGGWALRNMVSLSWSGEHKADRYVPVDTMVLEVVFKYVYPSQLFVLSTPLVDYVCEV